MSEVTFWENCNLNVNSKCLSANSIPVKGKCYYNSGRFLEIYGNLDNKINEDKVIKDYPIDIIKELYLPHILGRLINFGYNIHQPPFVWYDCSPDTLAINFTYNTNAIYRILSNLFNQKLIESGRIDNLLDKACILLSQIYKCNNYEIIKNINNNINMFIISRVIETLVGKKVYNSEKQEFDVTLLSLLMSIDMLYEYIDLNVEQKMALSVGKGVCFLEKYLTSSKLLKKDEYNVKDAAYRYYKKPLAIDDRQLLIEFVRKTVYQNREILMCAILDDATESVDDLFWIQDLILKFPKFKVVLLVNTAQISINFSFHMLNPILKSPIFIGLASSINKQLFIHKIHYPLISFQTNFLSSHAEQLIKQADFVYVKGANFFETLQLKEKDVFYAFVVYGPISKLYTGLNNFDAVFAYAPKGTKGFHHNKDHSKIITLYDIKRTK